MTIKHLDDDPTMPILLSSLYDLSIEKWIFIINGAGVGFFNDMPDDIFVIDDVFIRENATYTIASMKASGNPVPELFFKELQEAFNGNSSPNNDVEITDKLIFNSVRNGQVLHPEIVQVFGIILGMYIGIMKVGAKKFFIPNPENNLHPARQCKIGNVMVRFEDKLRDRWELRRSELNR